MNLFFTALHTPPDTSTGSPPPVLNPLGWLSVAGTNLPPSLPLVCGQGLSLAAVPALGYAVALGLRRSNFDPHLADGVVIMASMPTTVSTNVVYTQRAAGGCMCVVVLCLCS